jgi:hypothetical protein
VLRNFQPKNEINLKKQTMIEEFEKKNAYTDSRNRGCILTRKEDGSFSVFGENMKIRYAGDTDQYAVVDHANEFWDPVTSFTFVHTSEMNYKCVSAKDLFIYREGYYSPVSDQESGNDDLKIFLKTVWKIKSKQLSAKQRMDFIYESIYSRKSENKKDRPLLEESLQIIEELVAFSQGKITKTQEVLSFVGLNDVYLDDDDDGYCSIDQLLNIVNYENSDQDRLNKAYTALMGYHYYWIRNDLERNVRIVLNVVPKNVPKALEVLWKILCDSKVVHSIKAGGPNVAAEKLDSIIIYADRNQEGFQELLVEIKKATILTEDLLPALLNKLTNGIGVGSEPPQMKETFMSFGQKRVILSLMALDRADSEEEMLMLGADYFRRAGIDIKNPGYEIECESNLGIKEELAYLLSVWLTEDEEKNKK